VWDSPKQVVWRRIVVVYVTINLISYRCSPWCNHMDNFFVSYYFIYLIAQSASHWWGMFFIQQTSCLPYVFLIHSSWYIGIYIYSRYSLVFLTLYQLYYSLPSSTLISSSSLYLSVATWVTPQGRNSLPVVAQNLSFGSFIIYRFLAHGLRASFLVLVLKTLLINAMSTSPQ